MSFHIGPIILDVKGPVLEREEQEIINHPLVGGVILFARNYADSNQLTDLCRQIRATRKQPLLITVDQEGGRVQRFRNEGFTPLPPMGALGTLYQTHPDKALQLAEECGWLIAAELLAVGIDFSLTPVLDLNKELNSVIGNRAFGSKPSDVIALAFKLVQGLKKSGMAAVGKHFPGHGSVNLDSHLALPIDQREFKDIEADDLRPFAELIAAGLEGVMPAHILFPAVDAMPVSFSHYWLQTILRKKLNFKGLILSDDLNMKGSGFAGDYQSRAEAALDAGCDFILICNNRPGAIAILDHLKQDRFVPFEKVQPLQGKFSRSLRDLQASNEWKTIRNNLVESLMEKTA